jgi:hypothetical protein
MASDAMSCELEKIRQLVELESPEERLSGSCDSVVRVSCNYMRLSCN